MKLKTIAIMGLAYCCAGGGITAVCRDLGLEEQLHTAVESRPECANHLLRNVIAEMKRNQVQYDAETKVVMFNEVREMIEQTPETAEYLGPKAKARLRNGILENLVEKAKEISDKTIDAYEYTVERGKKLYDCFKGSK